MDRFMLYSRFAEAIRSTPSKRPPIRPYSKGSGIACAVVAFAGVPAAATDISGQTLVDATIVGQVSIETDLAVDVLGDLTLDEATVSFVSPRPTMRFERGSGTQSLFGEGTLFFESGSYSQLVFTDEIAVGEGIALDAATGPSGRLVFTEGALRLDGDLVVRPGSQVEIATRTFTHNGSITNGGRLYLGRPQSPGRRSDFTWANQGTITLESGSETHLQGTFTLEDLGNIQDGGGYVFHSGSLELQGATLDLESFPFENPLQLSGGEFRNGRLTSSGDATLDFLPTQYAAYFHNITLATDLVIPGGAGGTRVWSTGGLTLEGATITMPEGASLRFSEGNQVLGGTGTIYAPNQPNASSITHIAGSELVIEEGITIRNGTEAFRQLTVGFLENRGTIISEAPNTLVSIGDGSRWANNGVIRVVDGSLEFRGPYSVDDIGVLEFLGGEVVLRGDVLNQGKTILQNPSTGVWKFRGAVDGGRIESSDGVATDLGGVLDGVTLSGDAFVSDATGFGTGNVTIRNQLLLDHATLVIGDDRELGISAHAVLIGGDGEIILNGDPSHTRIQTFTGSELTLGPGVTVRTGDEGGGRISRSGLPVINQGTVIADTPGQTLLIDAEFTNHGELISKAGAMRTVGEVVNDGGRLVLEGGELLSDSISFVNGGRFDFESGRLAIGVFYADLVVPDAGVVAPGRLAVRGGAASMSIVGDYTQLPGSELEVLIASSGATNGADFLSVAGVAILDGELSLGMASSYRPIIGDTYVVMDATGISGEFDNVANGTRLITADGKSSFVVNYGAASAFDPTQIVLSDFIPTLPGDYNDDGAVDAADYTVWRDSVGASSGALPNDADGGVIGTAQYNTWQANYGRVLGSQALEVSRAVIPEPTTVTVAFVALALASARTARRSAKVGVRS